MLHIRFLWVGKTKDAYLRTGIETYLKKISPYVALECKEIKASNYSLGDVKHCKQRETESLLKQMHPDGTHILLDDRGKKQTSVEFSKWIENQQYQGTSHINFICGGAFGVETSLLPPQTQKLSLSPMTFNHQMVRLIFLEQLYRAFTIMKGEPYHHA